jgi:hypothetical protein
MRARRSEGGQRLSFRPGDRAGVERGRNYGPCRIFHTIRVNGEIHHETQNDESSDRKGVFSNYD